MVNSHEQILNQQSNLYGTYKKIGDNPRYKKAWKFILDRKNNGKKMVLDVGCANGDFSVGLMNHGFYCYGLEGAEDAINEAKRRGIKVTEGSFLEKFPFDDNSFDIVFAGEVIEHTIEDEKFLKEIHRVLNIGGLMILTTPNLVSLGNRFLMFLGKMPRFAYADFHYKIYNMETIESKVINSDFDIIKVESSYVLISTYFNKIIGKFGEFFGSLFPSLGEHFIIYAEKNDK